MTQDQSAEEIIKNAKESNPIIKTYGLQRKDFDVLWELNSDSFLSKDEMVKLSTDADLVTGHNLIYWFDHFDIGFTVTLNSFTARQCNDNVEVYFISSKDKIWSSQQDIHSLHEQTAFNSETYGKAWAIYKN